MHHSKFTCIVWIVRMTECRFQLLRGVFDRKPFFAGRQWRNVTFASGERSWPEVTSPLSSFVAGCVAQQHADYNSVGPTTNTMVQSSVAQSTVAPTMFCPKVLSPKITASYCDRRKFKKVLFTTALTPKFGILCLLSICFLCFVYESAWMWNLDRILLWKLLCCVMLLFVHNIHFGG